MKIAKAFAPANISLLFTIIPDPDPALMGSKGLGFTVNRGVTVTVSQATQTSILWNNSPIDLPTVRSLISQLTIIPLTVSVVTDLPLGCGFGLSGASALATAYAVNHLLQLKKTHLELAKMTHVAEVKERTGLGDVVNQYFGGFCLKTEVSSAFKIKALPLSDVSVFYRVFSDLSTKSILSDQTKVNKINQVGQHFVEKIAELAPQEVTITKLFKSAYEFCQQSEFLTEREVMKTIESIRLSGGQATMILVGNAVVADQPFSGSKELLISRTGAYLIT